MSPLPRRDLIAGTGAGFAGALLLHGMATWDAVRAARAVRARGPSSVCWQAISRAAPWAAGSSRPCSGINRAARRSPPAGAAVRPAVVDPLPTLLAWRDRAAGGRL